MVTCMDSRIAPLQMVGLAPGDAKIFRNPGGRVTPQALEALVLGVHLLGVRPHPRRPPHAVRDGDEHRGRAAPQDRGVERARTPRGSASGSSPTSATPSAATSRPCARTRSSRTGPRSGASSTTWTPGCSSRCCERCARGARHPAHRHRAAPRQEHRDPAACATARSSPGGSTATVGGWWSTRMPSASPPARTQPSSRSPPTPPATDPTLAHPLRLRAPGREPLDVALPDADAVPVTVHGRPLTGRPGEPSTPTPGCAAPWAATTSPSCTSPTPRPLNPQHARPGRGDGLRRRLPRHPRVRRLAAPAPRVGRRDRARAGRGAAAPLAIERFRPNLVVDGDLEPFEEDHWRRVRVGAVTFRVVKPVDRCVLTTVDPTTRERGHEPIRTLAQAPEVGRGDVVRGAARPRGPRDDQARRRGVARPVG